MKIRKSRLILICIVITVVLSNLVSALEITDPENDVDHIIKDPYSIEPVSSKPNLDVTKVTCSIDGGVVTLSLTVKGEIEDDSSITYYVEYECSDASYQFTYTNGNLNSKSSSIAGGESTMVGTATGHLIDPANTITAAFNVVGTGGTDGELYGYAGDDFPLGVDEYWMDNTVVDDGGPPNGGGQGTNGDGNTGGSGTPGFEAMAVIAALGIALIIFRKRK
jgi:LPXTG-motif cell wall-anchored protein